MTSQSSGPRPQARWSPACSSRSCSPRARSAWPRARARPRVRHRRRRLRRRHQQLNRRQLRRQRLHRRLTPRLGWPGGRGAPPPPPPPPPAVMPAPTEPTVSATAPTPDPRVGLRAGRWDAAEAGWNMRMISTTPPTGKTLGATHSDLAFSGKYAIQGNYNGFELFDISKPAKPVLVQSYLCPASQDDVSVTRTCSSCRPSRPTADPTAASAACPSRSARGACAASGSSTSRTSRARS